MLKECLTFVSAGIIKARGVDCEVGLFRRTVKKPVSQRDGVAVSIVKAIDRQNNVTGLLVFKAPINKVVVRVSC